MTADAKATRKTPLTTSAASSMIGFAVNLVVTFLLTPYLIEMLDQARYGVWALMLTVVGYAGILNLGIGPAVTRFVAQHLGESNPAQARKCIQTSLGIMLVSGVVLMVLGAVGAEPLRRFLEVPDDLAAEFTAVVRIMSVVAAITLLFQVYAGVLRAYEKFPLENAIRAAQAVVRGIGLALCLYWGGDMVALAYVWGGVMVASLVAVGAAAKATCPAASLSPLGGDRRTFVVLMTFGAAITIVSVANVFRFRLGNFIAAKYLTFQAVGLFNIASMIAGYFMTLVSVPMGVLLPRFSRQAGEGDDEGLARLFFRSARLNAVFASLTGVTILICSDGFLRLWLAGKYSPEQLGTCNGVLAVLVGVYVLGLSQVGSISLIYGKRRERFVTGLNVCEGAVILALSLVLVQTHGLLGMAVAIAGPMAASKLLIQPWFVSRLMGVTLAAFYRRCLVGPWALAGALYGIYWFLRPHLPITNWPALVVMGAVTSLAYGVPAYFGLIDPADRARIPVVSSLARMLARRRRSDGPGPTT